MIDHIHRFIFIHIPKAGGNSIKTALGIPKFPGDHTGIADKKYKKYQDYFKFSIVRNPWDSFASAYFFLRHGGIGLNYKRVNPDLKYINHINNNYCNFNDFVKSECWTRWKHFRPSCEYLTINGKLVIDFIGKFENLQEDFNIICDKIGIPHQQLPHKNKSKHEHYTEYYDDETREIVAEKYARDIEYFGYEFGE